MDSVKISEAYRSFIQYWDYKPEFSGGDRRNLDYND